MCWIECFIELYGKSFEILIQIKVFEILSYFFWICFETFELSDELMKNIMKES
jgi:hypothetical protein